MRKQSIGMYQQNRFHAYLIIIKVYLLSFLARLHEVHRAIVVTSVVLVYVYVYVYVRVTLSVKVF